MKKPALFRKALALCLLCAILFSLSPFSFATVTTLQCDCEVQCTEDSINENCPVCSEHFEVCIGSSEENEYEEDEPPTFGDEEDEEIEEAETPNGKGIDKEYLERIGDLSRQQSSLQEEQDRLNKLIAGAKSEKQKQQVIAGNIDAQIKINKESISVLEKKIKLTEDSIKEKEEDIAQKESEIADNMALFKSRIRALYFSGGSSKTANYITMLLTSQSISDFYTRTENLKRISEHDERIIEEMRSELGKIHEQKEIIEEQKQNLKKEKNDLSAQQESLRESYAIAAAAIHDIASMEAEYVANREAIEAQMQKVQEEIADIYAVYNSKYTDYVGGELAWPVPGFGNVTSTYGWRFGGSDFHTGIDISGGGVHGANIIAANTGTVMFVRTSGYSSGYSGGYGSYVILDHGGGISTLYAHCSNIYVSEGDVIAKGQIIASVGSTGWSTGPHLHFEVRQNGQHVNPLPYVRG